MDEVTGALAEQLEALENGGIEWFADWPVRTVPTSGVNAGVKSGHAAV